MDRAVITGSSSGIGKACVDLFLERGFEVHGIDMKDDSRSNPNFHFHLCDISKGELPVIDGVNILINNAGLQNSEDDIENNLVGTMKVTKKYAFQKDIKSVLFNISSSALTGFEFPEYVASKSGLVGYMKNVACILAKDYKATCNGISFGGVMTSLNDEVINDEKKWNEIMKVTPLKKWCTPKEAAEWIYFLTVINKSCSGQNILVDNGEKDLNNTFVW